MSSLYTDIIEKVFFDRYEEGDTDVVFERKALTEAARLLDREPPKNLDDLIYTFRHRKALPDSLVRSEVPECGGAAHGCPIDGQRRHRTF